MKKRDLMKNTVLLTSIMLLSSCAVGPDYVRPAAHVPLRFKEAHGQSLIATKKTTKSIKWKIAQPQDSYQRDKWWLVFNDPTLNNLEDRLNAANQTIINAYDNYQQARALVEEARASFFPTLSGSLSLNRQKNSNGSTSLISSSSSGTSTGTAATSNGSSNGSSSTITNTHAWLLDASWEPDIWGLVRRTVEAGQAGAEASAALYVSTRLSLQAMLAQTYFQLRGLDAIQQLLNATVASDKKALHLTQHQYAAGVAARSDIVQAQSALELAQAQAINNGILRSQYEHSIAVLIGLPPATFSLTAHPSPLPTTSIPLTVPSLLLERRPDIAQAERLMQQTNAQIGVAIAAYFPTLTLTGTASTASNSFGPLFAVPSLSWSLGSQLTETILDGGLRNATVKAATASYQASVANYRQVILTAFQDVEDNLVSIRILNDQTIVEKKAVASAQLALKLVLNQYKSGTVNYSSVITAQINAFTAQQNAINVDYLKMVSVVGLIKALGGGWDR